MDARKRLLAYIAANKWRFIIGAVLGLAASALEIQILGLLKPFVTAASEAHAGAKQIDSNLGSWSTIKHTTLILLALQIPKSIAVYGNFYTISSATTRIATSLRDELYEHVQRLSLSFFERNRIGDLMSRMTNDTALIQNGAAAVVDSVTAPCMVILGVGKMFLISWKLTLVCLIFAPGMSWLISRVTRRIRKLTIAFQMALANVASMIEETIAGIRIVKSFGMERHEINRFREENRKSMRAALKAARRNAAVTPVTECFGMLALASAMLVGGLQMTTRAMSLGDFVVFIAVGIYVSSNTKKLGRLSATYHQTMAGVERIFTVLDEMPDIEDAANAVELESCSGRVEFRGVHFSYQTGEEILPGLSFEMETGKSVAVVGPSGAGKSTIANLIPRLYDVTGGAVLVDGHDVREVKMASLRRHMAIVPQETILFSGTLRDNIAYGRPDATDEEIVEAAKAANAHNFIMGFEDGYGTIIGERGARLSGGERQRISIARAILKDPKILILDEATSSLDATSERLVQEALEKLMQGRTTLVIAHRLSTITNVDEIIVLAAGQIVERGSFSKLMAEDGVFARLYRSQYDVQAVGASAGASDSETALEES